jgi:hypothetical protein
MEEDELLVGSANRADRRPTKFTPREESEDSEENTAETAGR